MKSLISNGSGNGERGRSSFLRWVGGKQLLVKDLLAFLPESVDERVYREPFVGAASMYFALRPKRAVLSDLNEHLIECYRFIRDSHQLVARYLRDHAAANSETYYYKVREVYNRSQFSAAQAARFIYLNRTCFNGVFRVNMSGDFNVPFGDKPNPAFPSTDKLAEIGKTLKTARLLVCDYARGLQRASTGDFVYLDPPYPPLNGTSYFTHYTQARFGAEDQECVAQLVRDLDSRGCLVMMTNADTPIVRSLYRGFNLFELSVIRYVTCKNIRHRVGELVITNYAPQN